MLPVLLAAGPTLTQVPRAEFVELSHAGHTAAGDDNDAFSDVVVEFVERVAPT